MIMRMTVVIQIKSDKYLKKVIIMEKHNVRKKLKVHIKVNCKINEHATFNNNLSYCHKKDHQNVKFQQVSSYGLNYTYNYMQF